MIQLTSMIYVYYYGIKGLAISDYNKRLIQQSVIQLSGVHHISSQQEINFVLFLLNAKYLTFCLRICYDYTSNKRIQIIWVIRNLLSEEMEVVSTWEREYNKSVNLGPSLKTPRGPSINDVTQSWTFFGP